MSKPTYYERNKEKILCYNKLNRKKIREYYKLWYEKNKEELLKKRKDAEQCNNKIYINKVKNKVKKTKKKLIDYRGTTDNLKLDIEMCFY